MNDTGDRAPASSNSARVRTEWIGMSRAPADPGLGAAAAPPVGALPAHPNVAMPRRARGERPELLGGAPRAVDRGRPRTDRPRHAAGQLGVLRPLHPGRERGAGGDRPGLLDGPVDGGRDRHRRARRGIGRAAPRLLGAQRRDGGRGVGARAARRVQRLGRVQHADCSTTSAPPCSTGSTPRRTRWRPTGRSRAPRH